MDQRGCVTDQEFSHQTEDQELNEEGMMMAWQPKRERMKQRRVWLKIFALHSRKSDGCDKLTLIDSELTERLLTMQMGPLAGV